MHGRYIPIRIYALYPFGLPPRDKDITLPDKLVEFVGLLVHLRDRPPLLESRQPFPYRQVQKEGDIRGGVQRRGLCGLVDEPHIELPSVALIDDGGVVKPVAYHDFTVFQSGLYEVFNVLGPVRAKKKELGHRRQHQFPLVQYNRPYEIPQVSPAGLSRYRDLVPLPRQKFIQEICLCGFAAAFYTFERNEHIWIFPRG